MAITAAQVKELRERTGVGMMECKRALQESDGNVETAIEAMRKSGLAKATKRAGRIAAEGVTRMRVSDDQKTGIIIETNCETDFVAKDENFRGFVETVADRALAESCDSRDALLALPMVAGGGETIEGARQALVAKMGENVQIRRVTRLQSEGAVCAYSHGERIGVLVGLVNGDETLGKDLAMHIAASSPQALSADDVSAELLAKEREIFMAQAADSGKPVEIAEKMVEGRMKKFLKEVSLLGQPFVKDPQQSVEALLKAVGAQVTGFVRFQVGEGIEKEEVDFAAEVAQMRGEA